MKHTVAQPQEIFAEVVPTEASDEHVIRFLKKYRHLLLQTSSYGVVAIEPIDVSVDELLMNHPLLALITKLRSHNPVVRKSKETLISYVVELEQGSVSLSDFNHESTGVVFADDSCDMELDSNLPMSVQLKVYLYDSPFPTNTDSQNLSMLYDSLGGTDRLLVFNSNHQIVREFLVTDTTYKISVSAPYLVEEVIQLAKQQVISEISNISY